MVLGLFQSHPLFHKLQELGVKIIHWLPEQKHYSSPFLWPVTHNDSVSLCVNLSFTLVLLQIKISFRSFLIRSEVALST